ncbi:PDZ domain-containing protein [Amycolatopsis jejuensis]|uniref:PDZ domain-containing protein n=1 Tax=Amycolatopsis jejuensis TaxID=330084 RepID=UPI0005240127|nr:PDZ domain-containing protein [Amycolatopsis jejuensis]
MTRRRLDLVLQPVIDAPRSGVAVSYTVAGVSFAAGATICRLPKVIVGIPGAEIRRLRVADRGGTVPVSEAAGAANSSYTYRNWIARKETDGDLHVSYFAPVRAVDAWTVNGPLFDLRGDSAGIEGSGITFLALPELDDEFALTVSWDLTRMPPSARGVSSLGDGTVLTQAPLTRLTECFYMAGEVSQWPEPGPEQAAVMHWLSTPPFDAAAVADHVDRIFRAMSEFFDDREEGYRVFVRRHPYDGDGGTGFHRSFAFGYGPHGKPTVESLSALLAHETAHTWPRMDGGHGETAWYTEGTAEYYSLVIPYRAEIISAGEFARLVNERIRAYCTNPLRALGNDDAEGLFWTDSRALRLPYGRGLAYLLNLNAQLLEASGGERGVDDLVLEVLRRHRAGEAVTTSDWVELVVRELGERGSADFAAMTDGEPLTIRPDALGDEFTAAEVEVRGTELGFDFTSLTGGVVSGLVPGSPAAKAGVRDGDRIVSAPARTELMENPGGLVDLTLERGGEQVLVQYAGEGPPIHVLQWQEKRG